MPREWRGGQAASATSLQGHWQPSAIQDPITCLHTWPPPRTPPSLPHSPDGSLQEPFQVQPSPRVLRRSPIPVCSLGFLRGTPTGARRPNLENPGRGSSSLTRQGACGAFCWARVDSATPGAWDSGVQVQWDETRVAPSPPAQHTLSVTTELDKQSFAPGLRKPHDCRLFLFEGRRRRL